MSKHIVEISDKNDTSVQIVVDRPVLGQDNWSSLQKGVWAYERGAMQLIDKTNYNIFKGDPEDGITLHMHLILCNTPHVSWTGVMLWDFMGWTSVNTSGSGAMRDGWSLTMGYGNQNGFTPLRWKIVG
jgi:hypothetical protein